MTIQGMISQFKGAHSYLSNFYRGAPFSIEGVWYATGEHAFHALKAEAPADRFWIAGAATPSKAKYRGRQIKLPANWDDSGRYVAMRRVVWAKFGQNPQLKSWLLATNDAWLIEGNYHHDNHWGNCYCDRCADVRGENWLGRILMEYREDCRTDVVAF